MFPSRPATCPCHDTAASASGRPAAMSEVFLTICGIVRKRNGTVAHDARDIVTLSHRARVSVTHDGTLASLNGGATPVSDSSRSHGLTRARVSPNSSLPSSVSSSSSRDLSHGAGAGADEEDSARATTARRAALRGRTGRRGERRIVDSASATSWKARAGGRDGAVRSPERGILALDAARLVARDVSPGGPTPAALSPSPRARDEPTQPSSGVLVVAPRRLPSAVGRRGEPRRQARGFGPRATATARPAIVPHGEGSTMSIRRSIPPP
mmetsp:Transcript_9316/g.37749  ORF Transcript_9316/g.37749 Transcript_9316/m.37749 type:complete len:268 (+) Transcript_9316:1283-2086(+)